MVDNKMIEQFDGNLFDVFFSNYKGNLKLNTTFLKKVFLEVDIKYKNIISELPVTEMLLKNISVFDMINYIVAEHQFHISLIDPSKIDFLENDEKYFNQLVNVCLDKILVNEYKEVNSRAYISKYAVEISSLEMFLNRFLYLLANVSLDRNNIKTKLLLDIYAKCSILAKATLRDLCDGLETEALSSWRTFHELLSVLIVIDKGDDNVAKAYYRHLTYGAYSRGEIVDPEICNQIQKDIDKDMEALEVKKANKEKFINYGWIHWVYKRYNDEEVKMNFLGGLQKVADLTNYKKYYEIASDVTHSTPLLVYANKLNLTTTTLKITYEQFFIMEQRIINYILNENKIDPEKDESLKDYLKFKMKYKAKLELAYKLINSRYRKIGDKNGN